MDLKNAYYVKVSKLGSISRGRAEFKVIPYESEAGYWPRTNKLSLRRLRDFQHLACVRSMIYRLVNVSYLCQTLLYLLYCYCDFPIYLEFNATF